MPLLPQEVHGAGIRVFSRKPQAMDIPGIRRLKRENGSSDIIKRSVEDQIDATGKRHSTHLGQYTNIHESLCMWLQWDDPQIVPESAGRLTRPGIPKPISHDRPNNRASSS